MGHCIDHATEHLFDIVCFLEHDTLYPDDYFDRVADAFLAHPLAPVVSNLDYEGLNATGFLDVKERHEPMHQLSLQADYAINNLARCAVHFQAGAIPPAHMIANLPGLVAGRAIRSAGMRDVSGREMVIEAEHEPLSPIIDGERFTDITRLIVRPGPQICIAVPEPLNCQ